MNVYRVHICGECRAAKEIPMSGSGLELSKCDLCKTLTICAEFEVPETEADPLSEVGKHDWNKIDGWISPKGWVKPRKIIEFKTISTPNESDFNEGVVVLLNQGFVPFNDIVVSFGQTTTSPGLTPGFDRVHPGSRYLTQQFVKYEDENTEPKRNGFAEWEARNTTGIEK